MVFGEHISGTFHTRRCRGVRRGKKKRAYILNEAPAMYLGHNYNLQSTYLAHTRKVYKFIFANFFPHIWTTYYIIFLFRLIGDSQFLFSYVFLFSCRAQSNYYYLVRSPMRIFRRRRRVKYVSKVSEHPTINFLSYSVRISCCIIRFS